MVELGVLLIRMLHLIDVVPHSKTLVIQPSFIDFFRIYNNKKQTI
jgi:hypothetical protein